MVGGDILKNIFIAAYAYIAALIGAGFASGQEILCYFNRFGRYGFYGIIIAALTFAVFAYIIFYTCVCIKAESFDDFLAIFPGKNTSRIFRFLTGLFSFAVFAVMLAAFGEICAYATGIPQKYSALAAAAVCAVLLCRGPDGIITLNGLIGIILAIGIAYCCFYILRYREFHVFSYGGEITGNALIYSGYNLITVIPVLAVTSRRLKSGADAAASSVISGMVFFILMSLIFCILAIYEGKVNLGEFPMLTMAYRQNKILGCFYGLLLGASIITTLLASAESVSETFAIRKKHIRAAAVTAIAYMLSGMGFGTLVDTAYRITGIIGFVICCIVSALCIKAIIKSKIKDI